jgi:hypothetical protein
MYYIFKGLGKSCWKLKLVTGVEIYIFFDMIYTYLYYVEPEIGYIHYIFVGASVFTSTCSDYFGSNYSRYRLQL